MPSKKIPSPQERPDLYDDYDFRESTESSVTIPDSVLRCLKDIEDKEIEKKKIG